GTKLTFASSFSTAGPWSMKPYVRISSLSSFTFSAWGSSVVLISARLLGPEGLLAGLPDAGFFSGGRSISSAVGRTDVCTSRRATGARLAAGGGGAAGAAGLASAWYVKAPPHLGHLTF